MENLIKYIVDYVIEDKVSVYRSGTWLFALLACIEAPLCMTLMKKLRDLVRKCRKIRGKMVKQMLYSKLSLYGSKPIKFIILKSSRIIKLFITQN